MSIKITDHKIYVKSIKHKMDICVGIVTDTYIKLIRDENKHTFWKFRAWGINKEVVDYAIKTGRNIIVLATNKQKEKENYLIYNNGLTKFITKYECEFDFHGEMQYVIPKTFFFFKKEDDLIYAVPSYSTNLLTKKVALSEEASFGDTVFIP